MSEALSTECNTLLSQRVVSGDSYGNLEAEGWRVLVRKVSERSKTRTAPYHLSRVVDSIFAMGNVIAA